jgi:dTDP-4-dehydrorhamnose 3,5-epimerase
MRRLPTRLEGPIVLEPARHPDGRGFFSETYRQDAYRAAGIDADFVQDNHSRSVRGTLRGLHYQRSPGQAKLVGVARGRIQDVVVDLRLDSPTFGEWESWVISDRVPRQVYVPIGFAHGFVVLSTMADVIYKVGSYYDAAQEAGVAWDDPELAIGWRIANPTLSARDRANPTLAQVRSELAGRR